MAYENIHVDDYGWLARLRLVQDGAAVDISGYTTRTIIFRKPDETEVSKTATFTTDGTDGYLQYTVESGVIDTIGRWRVWAQVSADGVVLTSDPVRFVVVRRGQ